MNNIEEKIKILNELKISINKNKKFVNNNENLILKANIGDFYIKLLNYDEYFSEAHNEQGGSYPDTRHINFDFYVYGKYIEPKFIYDNTVRKGDLFDFDVYLTYSKNDFKYHISFYFFYNDINYKNFDIETIFDIW